MFLRERKYISIVFIKKASTEGYKDIVKILIENKANVNMKKLYGETALIYGT